MVRTVESPDDAQEAADGVPFVSPFAVAELRLSNGLDPGAIAGIVLDALVPSVADAGAVFAAEWLLRGNGLAARDGKTPLTVRRIGARSSGGQSLTGAFPEGEVLIPAAGSPYDRCTRFGAPVTFTRPDSETLSRASRAGRDTLARFASFLAVPVTGGGIVTGLLVLARSAGRPAFGDADTAVAARLAAHAGNSIVNAVALARHLAISHALQRGLLAADLPAPAGLEVAGRCVSAAESLIGGDWYDLVPLPRGRTGLVVGDVMGHGPEASAAMAQLRAAAHALAQVGLAPAELLAQLDKTIMTLRGAPLVTCLCAIVDPAGLGCTLSAAGHLPPVLSVPGGGTRILDLPPGQSLGIGPAAYGQAYIRLQPGAILAFYTDGLVETHTRSYDQGISILRSELEHGQGTLEERCDALIEALAHDPADDVTLILVRVPEDQGTASERV